MLHHAANHSSTIPTPSSQPRYRAVGLHVSSICKPQLMSVQGYSKPSQLAIQSGTGPSLKQVLAGRRPVWCSTCSKQASVSQRHADPVIGSIKLLPRIQDIEYWTPTSVILRQGLNDGAGGHPCLVAARSDCGHLLFCMPITSFDGRGLAEKYVYCRNPETLREIMGQYVPMEHDDNSDTISLAHGHELAETTGPRLPKQSYIHLGEVSIHHEPHWTPEMMLTHSAGLLG